MLDPFYTDHCLERIRPEWRVLDVLRAIARCERVFCRRQKAEETGLEVIVSV